jgi:hypothetical protein
MADPTHSDKAAKSHAAEAPSADGSGNDLAPVAKVTRAQAKTSDVPTVDVAAKVDPPASKGAASKAAAPAEAPARPARVEIHQGGADSVAGDSVSITQGGASVVNARSVEVRQGGIANAQADDITVTMGGIALARADRISVDMGGLGIGFAREVQVTQGLARSVVAQDIRIDQGLVGTALAGRVTFERQSGVLLLIAGRVEGPVKAVFDWRGALAFGAAFGLLVGLIRRR